MSIHLRQFFFIGVFILSLLLSSIETTQSESNYIVLASSTSTENSGLFAHLLPMFESQTGIKVRVVAVGTGQAIKLAKNGDADLLLVHHRPSEEKFVAQGFGVKRHDVMYNDFVIVGDKKDVARIGGLKDAPGALAKIASIKATFVSRGDDSGTHKKEIELWSLSKLNPKTGSGLWYLETGLGMGAALNMSASEGAYTLSDRGTWLGFKNKRDLRVLVEGDKRLFNPYGIILANPKRFKHIKAEAGQKFIDWLLSPVGQAAVSEFKVDGQQLFFPNAVTN